MKQIFICLILSIAFISCKDKQPKGEKEFTSAYVCPMHCKGSGSDAPGDCPVCGMPYVKNDGKDAPHQHEGHDHHDHEHRHESDTTHQH